MVSLPHLNYKQNFHLKTKFNMENKTSTNHENGNDANKRLADGLTFSFNEGVMWGDNPFEIKTNESCSAYGGEHCKHCHSHKEILHERSDKSTYTEDVWVCPVVVVVTNEGGCNSTGLCLDCLLEAVKKLNLR